MWSCKKREILYDGVAGCGKSRAVLEKANLAAMKYPGSRILLVRKTRASLTESMLVTLEQHVLPEGSCVLVGPSRQQRQAYMYPNKSTIVLGGLDHVERIMSTEYDMIIIGEATDGVSENDFEMLLTRLRNGKMPYQQAIADCNPSYPGHWLKKRADAGIMHRIMGKHDDNPHITAEYLEQLSKLSGHRRARLFEGKWCASEGLIYDRWHDDFIQQRSEDWARIVIGVDQGYTNPCAIHVYGIDGDGRMHCIEEFYRRGQLESSVVKHLQELEAKHSPEAIVCDPAAKTLIAAMENHGMPVQGAENDVFGGIQACQNRLVVPEDGRPRFTVDPSCQNFIQEIQSYEWAQNTDGSRKDKPTKENDHCLVSGTMILTEDGERAIETVKNGDRVWTREGLRRVKSAGMTNPCAKVKRVTLSNGRTLIGTALHPVLTDGKWIPLDYLRYGDVLHSKEESLCQERQCGSAEGFTQGTQRQARSLTGCTSKTTVGSYIAMFGNTITDKYQKVITYITSTTTRATTILRTLCFSALVSTQRFILDQQAKHRNSIWNLFDRWLLNGIALRLAVGGIHNTASGYKQTSSLKTWNASNAGIHTNLSSRSQSSVQTSAKRHRAGRPESMILAGNACGVVRSSWLTNTPKQPSAPISVLSVTDAPDSPVYNLTVDETPEYFASGVLVHNCMDNWRYSTMYVDANSGDMTVISI